MKRSKLGYELLGVHVSNSDPSSTKDDGTIHKTDDLSRGSTGFVWSAGFRSRPAVLVSNAGVSFIALLTLLSLDPLDPLDPLEFTKSQHGCSHCSSKRQPQERCRVALHQTSNQMAAQPWGESALLIVGAPLSFPLAHERKHVQTLHTQPSIR